MVPHDLPARNRVRFIRPDGSAIATKPVASTPPPGRHQFRERGAYSMTLTHPEQTLTTDANGSVLLASETPSATARSWLCRWANGVVIVEI